MVPEVRSHSPESTPPDLRARVRHLRQSGTAYHRTTQHRVAYIHRQSKVVCPTHQPTSTRRSVLQPSPLVAHATLSTVPRTGRSVARLPFPRTARWTHIATPQSWPPASALERTSAPTVERCSSTACSDRPIPSTSPYSTVSQQSVNSPRPSLRAPYNHALTSVSHDTVSDCTATAPRLTITR